MCCFFFFIDISDVSDIDDTELESEYEKSENKSQRTDNRSENRSQISLDPQIEDPEEIEFLREKEITIETPLPDGWRRFVDAKGFKYFFS